MALALGWQVFEERMHEVAPDLNGTLEDTYVDDDEVQQQDAVEDDEVQHEHEHGDGDGDEEEHDASAHDEYQKGGSEAKDTMVENDPTGSPTASQGKASSSGLVASGPSSSCSRMPPVGGTVLWLGLRRGLHVGG